MIADLDETIRQLLIAELPVKNGEIDISFEQPKREWSARISKPTVNMFLYDLRENPTLRQHGWERLAGGNGSNLAHLKRTPLRVDCLYMLTTWAAEPDDEHRLMTRALMALFRFPVIPDDRLLGSLKNPPFEIQARLASHDRLTNPAEVWSSLDNEMRPSISYIITLALDPWQEVTGPAVRTLTLRAGQAGDLPRKAEFLPATDSDEMIFIGGTLWDDDAPAAGINVAVKGTGLFTTTNDEGQYTLGSLQPGEYTLVAWPEDGKPKEKKISVPPEDGDYDLEIG
jgi:hypothetical protein